MGKLIHEQLSTDKIHPCNQCHPWLNTQTVDHMQVIALARDVGEQFRLEPVRKGFFVWE